MSTQLQSLLPLLLLVVVFYFIILRPQQTQQKKRQTMLNALHKGDRVVTIGGLYGTLTEIKDDRVKLRIADKVEVEVARAGIDHVRKEATKGSETEAKAADSAQDSAKDEARD
ncbi:MAG: preprotein translocase subunit YajC [Bacillota bacterium]